VLAYRIDSLVRNNAPVRVLSTHTNDIASMGPQAGTHLAKWLMPRWLRYTILYDDGE